MAVPVSELNCSLEATLPEINGEPEPHEFHAAPYVIDDPRTIKN